MPWRTHILGHRESLATDWPNDYAGKATCLRGGAMKEVGSSVLLSLTNTAKEVCHTVSRVRAEAWDVEKRRQMVT